MRAFVTGAAGYVGSAVAQAFVEAGHDVTGLHRSEGGAAVVEALGATPVHGDLEDPTAWESAARDHDVYVHAAYDPERTVPVDKAAIEALLRLTGGAGARPEQMLIYTSGCWVVGETGGEPVDEETASVASPAEAAAWRPAHEELVLVASTRRVPTAVIRPGMVYGGGGGLVARLFATAVEEAAAAFVGDGTNRWSLVHRADLGAYYLRVATTRAAGVFHAVDGRPVRVAEVARAASEAAGAGGATRAVPVAEARAELGPVADALALDQTLVTRRSQEIGWAPSRSSFPDTAGEAYDEWREGATATA